MTEGGQEAQCPEGRCELAAEVARLAAQAEELGAMAAASSGVKRGRVGSKTLGDWVAATR